MIRRYVILDPITLERTGRVVALDLDDRRLTSLTVLADDLGRSIGPVAQLQRGADTTARIDALVDHGHFPSGEAPPYRPRRNQPRAA